MRRALYEVARMHRAVAQQQLALTVRPAARVDRAHVERALGQLHPPRPVALAGLAAGERRGGAPLRAGARLRRLPCLRRHRRELLWSHSHGAQLGRELLHLIVAPHRVAPWVGELLVHIGLLRGHADAL